MFHRTRLGRGLMMEWSKTAFGVNAPPLVRADVARAVAD